MDMTSSVCWMIGPIYLCVLVPHNDTEDPTEAATNVPLLARTMHPCFPL